MAWWWLLAGCVGTCPQSAPRFVELGTGSEAYVPAPPGATLRPVFGPQGGFHYDLSLRMAGFASWTPVRILGTHEDRTVIDQYSAPRLRCERSERSLYALGIHLFPDIRLQDTGAPPDTGEPGSLAGAEVELVVEVGEEGDDVVSATTTWVFAAP